MSGASAGPKDANHCFAPNGVDLNELYGVADQIVAGFCPQLNAGQHWTRTILWQMAESFERVPDGFMPEGDTPLEDFVAKFVAVKYVIDPGTPQQRTFIDPTSDKLWTGILGGFPSVNTLTLSRLRPLHVGQHVVEVYWVFSGMHCDGLGDDPALNCLPDGETLLAATEVEVTPGHH